MRDCKNCIHRTKNGCDSWDCEFEKRMTNEEAIKVLEMVEAHGIADRAKRSAIRALKNEQTDGDLQKEIDFWHIKCTEYEQTIAKMAVELNDVKAIPSAEKIAVFKIVGNTTQHYECSKCNEPVDGWDKYCKHCGARLVL